MLNKQIAGAVFGLNQVAEFTTVDDAGVSVLTPASDPSSRFNFYCLSVSEIEGNPIEFAGMNTTHNCNASVQGGVLYVMTSGAAVEGSALVQIT
jgi:hypothetical protein